MIKFLLISCLVSVAFINDVAGQYTQYRVCATRAHQAECDILQRGRSEVSCTYVQDAIECAQHIRNGTIPKGAQFGLFSAESVLQLATLGWEDLLVVKESRHKSHFNERTEFQSVVVVKDPNFRGGLDNLKQKNFCHPGLSYTRAEKWTERLLKTFERVTVEPQCNALKNASVAEIEAYSLAKYFNAVCRPGTWSHNVEEDKYLKKTYPDLCALCDDPLTCEYKATGSPADSAHRRALECLKKHGQVTVVSAAAAKEFFKENVENVNQYQYLCRNGTVHPINTTNPCTWDEQHWSVVMTNGNKSIELKAALTRWNSGNEDWQIAVKDILTQRGNNVLMDTDIQSPQRYVAVARGVPEPTPICNKVINWCTRNADETNKCKVSRAGGLSSGAYPLIECNEAYPSNNVVACLDTISKDRNDIMGIDSNYGYIARNNFNLTSVMYDETDDQHYSKVVILIKSNSRINKFVDLKGKKACFPEFGGIASIAFVDVGRSVGIFNRNECNYGRLLANFFGDSCAPGAKNVLHNQVTRLSSSPEADKLCNLCRYQGSERRFDVDIETIGAGNNPNVRGQLIADPRIKRQISGHCDPTFNNQYFGTRGALTCLHEVGEVAVLELRKLKTFADEMKLDQSQYSIMCRNGTIVPINNFQVDQNCPLITMVDGEVVIKRRNPKTKDVVHVLNSFDRYFNLNSNPDFKIFDKFNGVEDLLFEDSTIGLISANATDFGPSVQNYIRLFSNTDNCVEKKNSATTTTFSALIMIVSVFLTILMQ